MAFRITDITHTRIQNEPMFIHGDEFDSTCEVWFPSLWTSEIVTSHTADSITVTDEARRRDQVRFVIQNGHSLPAWTSNAGKTLVQSHTMSIHDSQTISLQATHYAPFWVTKGSRTIWSNAFISTKPEIWNVEAFVRPEFNPIKPGENFMVTGINLTKARKDPPITWLFLASDTTGAGIFEIEAYSPNRTNTGGLDSDLAFNARARKKVSRATLTTPNQVNANCTVGFVSTGTGSTQNNNRIVFASGGSLAVAVTSNGSGSDVTVTFVNGVTTANDVIALVNGDAAARAVVRAFKGYLGDGTGTVSAFVATNLTGGQDAGPVASQTYRIATQTSVSHYGVAVFADSFVISDTLFPVANTVDCTTSFVYNAVTYNLVNTDTSENQTKAFYAAFCRAAELHAADVTKRVVVKINPGVYRTTRPLVIPNHCCLCVANGGRATIQADPDLDFADTNLGPSYPAKPPSYPTLVCNSFPLYPSLVIMLSGGEIRDVDLVITRQNFPTKYVPSNGITLYGVTGSYPNAGFVIEDVTITDKCLYTTDQKPTSWTLYRPAAIFQTDLAIRTRINNVQAVCQLFKDISSGNCQYGTIDNVLAESPTGIPEMGGVGRLGYGYWFVRNVYWKNFYRGITDSGNLGLRMYRNFYMHLGPVGFTPFNSDGSEQFLVEGWSYPLNSVTLPDNQTVVGRSAFTAATNVSPINPVANTCFAYIMSGPGRGQIRRITSVSGGFSAGDANVKWTFGLESEWLSPPTADSVIVVGHMSNENIIISYRSGASMRGICLYNSINNWHIVDGVFTNVDNPIWAATHRMKSASGSSYDRLEMVSNIYIHRNAFVNCGDAFLFTMIEYGESGLNAGTRRTEAVGHHIYFSKNNFVNNSIVFQSSINPASTPDFTSIIVSYSGFDTSYLAAKREMGTAGSQEFLHPKPRMYPALPVVFGNVDKAWPVREFGNIVCGQLVTSRNDVGSPPPDGQKDRLTGGSTNLWGPQTRVYDMRGSISNRSYLAKPTGIAYTEGLDGSIALGGILKSGNTLSNNPVLTGTRQTVEDYVVSITADISGIKAQTDKMQFDVSNKVIASVGADMSSITASLSSIETKVDTANSSLSSVSSTVGTVNTNVNSVNTKVDTLTTNLGTANTNISAVKTKTDQLVFVSGDVRATIADEYTALNGGYNTLILVLSGVGTTLGSVDTKTTAIQTTVNSVNTKIGASTDVLPTNDTVWARLKQTDNNAAFAAASAEEAANDASLIKAKTEQLSFSGGDVVATISNEYTSLDAALSSITTTVGGINTLAGTIDTKVTAVKTKTDGMTVSGGNVRAKLSTDGLSDVDLVESAGVFTKLQAGLSWLLARFANSSTLDRSGKTLTVRDRNGQILTVQNFEATDTTETVDKIEGV